jgi:hypothetical protein
MLPQLDAGASLANPKLVLIAALGNLVVIAGCFAIYGWNAEGAGVATRATARFAICFFLAGFAAPGIRKWVAGYPEAGGLIQAFVAAQMVHFCAVIALHTKFATAPQHLSGAQAGGIVAGFTIVLAAGIAASARSRSKASRAAGVALLYILWVIFALVYAKHPVHSFRLVEIGVVLAMVLRHVPGRGDRETGAILSE